jgi:hypothetical protein
MEVILDGKSCRLMFKKVLLFIGVFSLMISIFAFGSDLKLRVITKKANVRLKPSLNSDILSRVPFGAILESEGKTGNWFRVNLPADKSGFVVSGYIHESTIEVIKESEKVQKYEKPKKAEKIYKDREVKRVKKRIARRNKKKGIIEKGLKIGLNFASLQHPWTNVDMNSKIGLNLGGFLTYSINDTFSVQIEILYTEKGVKYHIYFEYGEYHLYETYRMNYIEIPLLVKLKLSNILSIKQKFNPFIYAGPFYAIKLSGKLIYEYENIDEDPGEFDLALKSYDFGLIIGAGAEFNVDFFGKRKFLVDIRYNMGLIQNDPWYKEEFIKTKVISLMVGCFF